MGPRTSLSYHCTIECGDVAMVDDDDNGDGDRAMTRWRWCDYGNEVMLFRAIDIASSQHLCTCAVSNYIRKWRQMWKFIDHTNVNKEKLDHTIIPETLIFLNCYVQYCCKCIKKVLILYLDINLKKSLMNAVAHTGKMEKGNIIGWFHYHDSVL